jgi:hypothetical protein
VHDPAQLTSHCGQFYSFSRRSNVNRWYASHSDTGAGLSASFFLRTCSEDLYIEDLEGIPEYVT